MPKSDNALSRIVGQPLQEASYEFRDRVWVRVFAEVSHAVEILRKQGRQPSYTVEFGVVIGEARYGRLRAAKGILVDRWSTFLTKEEPSTDWWVTFDDSGPVLTAYGELAGVSGLTDFAA